MNASFLSRVLIAVSLIFGAIATCPVMAQPIDRQGGFVEPEPGHGQQPPRGVWYLGVFGSYSDTGLLLTEVTPGTPAVRAGLEVGDRIVAVNGQQIGLIGNTRLNLDVALQRHASRGGMVRLLIQDRRTQRLVTLNVKLVRGQVYF